MKEIIRNGIAIEVQRESDGWHAWAYRKVKGKWFVVGAISPRDTKEKARAAVIALAK